MRPQPSLKSGTAFLLAAIMASFAIGNDALQVSEKADAPGAKKDLDKQVATQIGKAAEKPGTKPLVADDRSADEKAIRSMGDAYVKAFSEADAKAIAAMFVTDAEYIDEKEKVHRGRQDIEGVMKECFAANPGGKITLNIDSIRFVGLNMALEDGNTILRPAGNDVESIYSKYSAVHVKSDGKWLTASLRELAPKDRRDHRAQLRSLAWLQGDWIDEGGASSVSFSCVPVDGGNFLVRKYTIHFAGQVALGGTQRIGWDPMNGKLKSWIFDSEGGFSEGFWHRDQDRWVLKSTGVTANGQPASSTTIYTIINEHRMTWQTVDHEIAGVELPDREPVTIVRRAPVPDVATKAE